MTIFRTLYAFDAVVALVVLYFFFAGLSAGTVSSFNGHLWLAILGALAAVLVGGPLLRTSGYPRAANGLLLILAIPGLLYALFVLSLVVLQPRWI